MHLSESDWAHVDERAEHFTGREWVFARVRSFLASEARLLVIEATPGSGKTAIAARLAQASDGRLPGEPTLPVPAGTLAAAVFCQAGQVSLLDVAQVLADQLSTALEGFAAEQRLTVAPQVDISDVHAQADEIHPGGTVIGVKVDLARLGPERAFADGLALPLRRLAETPGFRPPVLLVDSLDEAYASPVAQQLPGLLADLGGARLILTTRDDPRVLSAIGLDGAVAADRAAVVHLVDDAPAGIDDVADYVSARLRGQGPADAIAVLARRIGEAATGNFLYAYHVVGELLASSTLGGLDVTTAADVPLPEDGLAGVYGEFLRRVVGTDRGRWRTSVRPILAPLAVALGNGLDTTQLAAVGTILAGQSLSLTSAGDVTEDLGQFLEGSRPDGPFRLYHRSFADFLLDPTQTSGFRIEAAEAHAAIVDALTPRDAARNDAWSRAGAYARHHLAEHAAGCGRLDALLADVGFLAEADVDQLLPLLWNATSAEAREAAAAVQLASADLRGRPADERASYLELAARMRGADAIGNRIEALFPDRPWSVPAASWRTPTPNISLKGHLSEVNSVSLGDIDGRPIAVSSGHDGTVRMWDLRTLTPLGDPLTGHEGGVTAVAIGVVDDRPVAVSGGTDLTVRVWDLQMRQPISQPLRGHEKFVNLVAFGAVDNHPVAISAGWEGTVCLWDLRTMAPRGEPLPGREGGVAAIGEVGGHPVAVRYDDQDVLRMWDLTSNTAGGADLGLGADVMAVGQVGARSVTVCGSANGDIQVWDLGTHAWLTDPVHGHRDQVVSLAIGSIRDRPVVVSGGWDGTVRLWDLGTLEPLGEPLRGHDGPVRAVAIGEIDSRPVVVSGGWDTTVRVWDLGVLAPPSGRFMGHDDTVWTVAVGSVDGRPVVVSGGEDCTVRVWDLDGLDAVGEPLAGHEKAVRSVAVGAIGQRAVAVSASWDDTIRVWDLETLAQLREPVRGKERWVVSVAIGEIDHRPVVAGGDLQGVIRTWDLATLAHPSPIASLLQRADRGRVISGHQTGSESAGGIMKKAVWAIGVGLVDDRPVAVSGGGDGAVRIWDLRTGAPMGQPLQAALSVGSTGPAGAGDDPLRGAVLALAVGEVDKRPVAISGAGDGTIRVWDLRALGPLGEPLRGHKGNVTAVAIGELNSRPAVVSGGDDGTVRWWDLRSGTQLRQVSIPTVTGIALADATRIVVSARSGLIVVRVGRPNPAAT